MKKWFIIIPIFLIIVIVSIIEGRKIYWDYRIKNAIIKVEVDDTPIPVFEKNVKVSSRIKEINGELKKDPKIDTTKIGKQTISFQYINEENLPITYSIEVEVVDNTPPIIFQSKSKSIPLGYKEDLAKELFCGDNYDPNPKCTIEGEYNVNVPGVYPLTFIGIDSSGNESKNSFNLTVLKKSSSSSSSSSSTSYTDFEEVKRTYQGENVHFGIDISHWQGDINFKKVKEAGVEFAYIRIGRGDGIGKDYVEDRKFEQNLKGFNDVGIPIGVYFYSSANSKEDARKEAEWLLKRIKKYKVDLEVVYDWENWEYFQEYDLSFYQLTETAKEFNKTVNKAGYTGMLYGSKYYLTSIWGEVDFPVWLAHYTKQTNYEGDYVVWQLCADGKVNGISGTVDLDIRYGDLKTN